MEDVLKFHGSIWGPATWHLLYCLAFSFPDNIVSEAVNRLKTMLENLCLPCENCQEKYDALIALNPIDLSNRVNFVKWIMKIHSLERTERKAQNFQESDTVERYQKLSNCGTENEKFPKCSYCDFPPQACIDYSKNPLHFHGSKWSSLWTVLYCLAFSFSGPNPRLATMLQNLCLPCRGCQAHYDEALKTYPVNLQSRKEFIEWVLNIQNSFQKFRNLKEVSLSEVISIYKSHALVSHFMFIQKPCENCKHKKASEN